MKLRVAAAATLVLVLAACGGPTTPPPAPNPTPQPSPGSHPRPGATANNSAVLSGAALGSGTTPNSELRREISASVKVENTTFSLDSAYATRISADTETLDWFIAVTNQGSSLQCFVEASTLEFRDSAGQILTTDDFTFVSGSVGVDQSLATYTDTCLGSGETGYFFGIELEDDVPALYSSVDSIVIATLESDAGFDASTARILPQSYAVTAGGPSVTVHNEGTSAARIGDFSNFFFLDESNLPLTWGFFENDLNSLNDNPVVDTGETHIIDEPFSFYDGFSSKVQVQVDFGSPTGPLSAGNLAHSTEVLDAETTKNWHTEQRSQLERAKHEAVEKLRRTR